MIEGWEVIVGTRLLAGVVVSARSPLDGGLLSIGFLPLRQDRSKSDGSGEARLGAGVLFCMLICAGYPLDFLFTAYERRAWIQP